MRTPIIVDLTAKNVSTSRHLGALADALLTAQSDRVLVSFGPNESDARVTSTFAKWVERNDRLIRTRVKAFALVVPSLGVYLQWRLFLFFSQPVAPSKVHRTEAKALQWLEATWRLSQEAVVLEDSLLG
jgi:hypothetical protein